MTRLIKTNIKFYDGLNNVEGRKYGFVTKKKGSWRGCRESESKKKVVLPDMAIAGEIIPNVLYKCTLLPISEGNAFIAKTASIVKFKGLIKTTTNMKKEVFQVSVTFGNRHIRYNPASKNENQSSIQRIANELRASVDLINANQVAEDFISCASTVKRMYQQSLEDVRR